MTENFWGSSRSKHIDVCHHFLRELVVNGNISVEGVPTKEQHTDTLTKALSSNREDFEIHRDSLIGLNE